MDINENLTEMYDHQKSMTIFQSFKCDKSICEKKFDKNVVRMDEN